ncbi:MAG: phosphoribosylformylglycinamidine synthase subunit PurL [Syntrophomonadaceae bacterium]|jgi:phosphoribosylformylglycinamidine synthase II|nr:phosphoribosylformylglycinamidine synthase subunit PurL [Syntrophomonadaceae bacterium]
MKELSYREMGLTDEEYQKAVELLGRTPNYLELGMFAVMWSEHCGYKNSRPLLKRFPTQGPQVIQGPGENAGVVDIGDQQALVFKIESHNHPSAIEPYQGAATGVGGIVRDIFTMGARPIALLNSLRFGQLEEAQVKALFAGVVKGIGDYGNCIGVPTVGGEVYFNASYRGNPLVNAMCVGLAHRDELTFAVASEAGSPIMLVGAKTGRDGIHGATFASEQLSQSSAEKRPAVQVGDPFMEKLLIEACLELIKEGLVAGMQDLGAAGLTSSIAEIASKKGRGVEIDVLKVPRREAGMTPYEVMLSESQERMLVVPREGKQGRITEIFAKWGLDAAVIGRVTGDGLFKVFEGQELKASVPVLALTESCPVYTRQGQEPIYYKEKQAFEWGALPDEFNEKTLLTLLASPNIASKKWVYSQYDHQVMLNTVVLPGQGDAAVLRIKGYAKGIALVTDCNARMVYLDPLRGGMLAVCEAARNLACVGARPLALTNCLNFGNPENPTIYWQMREAIEGMSRAAAILNTPVVGGNVSLYNETEAGAIFPTPVIGMVGLIDNIENRLDMAIKNSGEIIALLGGLSTELGGAEYLALIHGEESGAVPEPDLMREKALIDLLLELSAKRLLSSCHDVSEGGLAVALAEMAIAGAMGFTVDLPGVRGRADEVMFSEAPGRVVVSLPERNFGEVEALAKIYDVNIHRLGTTGGRLLRYNVEGRQEVSIALEQAARSWEEAIACHMS